MILIVTDFFDFTTREVIEWLHYSTKEFTCIIPESKVELRFLSISNENKESFSILKDDKQVINIREINSFWYRRGQINLKVPDISHIDSVDIKNYFKIHLFSENQTILKYIYSALEGKKCLGRFSNRTLNKLTTLEKAQSIGLKIPNTQIISEKAKLKKFKKENKRIITKSIQDLIQVKYEEEYFTNFTELVDDEIINSSPDRFFPTLFQQQIIKRYELRIFYIAGEFYPMAIFSQKDSQTEIDFRKYNDFIPNRTVPFQLPIYIEEMLSKLLKCLNLNTGSIDMIVSDKKEYFFLEINPVGQFGMVSHPCNYYLEKRVANYLSSN